MTEGHFSLDLSHSRIILQRDLPRDRAVRVEGSYILYRILNHQSSQCNTSKTFHKCLCMNHQTVTAVMSIIIMLLNRTLGLWDFCAIVQINNLLSLLFDTFINIFTRSQKTSAAYLSSICISLLRLLTKSTSILNMVLYCFSLIKYMVKQ